MNFQISLGYSDKKFGKFFISFLSYVIETSTNKEDKVQIASATYEKSLSENSQFRLTVGTDLKS